MVAPVTGPFTKTWTRTGRKTALGYVPRWFTATRTWKRQAKPFTVPLPFSFQSSEVKGFFSYDGISYAEDSGGIYTFGNMLSGTNAQLTFNKAHSKYVSEIAAVTAEMAMNIATRQQALDMIAQRLIDMRNVLTALRRGSAKDLRKSLRKGFKYNGKAKSKSTGSQRGLHHTKSAADLWLEYHFGWDPLIKDIQAAAEVLDTGIPPSSAQGRSSRTVTIPLYSSQDDIYQLVKVGGEELMGYKIGSNVGVTNPDLWLANQMGVINPAVVAWDLVPFSFVLGWVVNVSQWLEAFNGFWGLSFTGEYTTGFSRTFSTRIEYQKNFPSSGKVTMYTRAGFEKVKVNRVIGPIARPRLMLTLPQRLSASRGATMASLLLQMMR